ncbi:hypothetical protein HYV88_03810 [Candidatus Woesearchaeota archaeon]|nr:hypothetical protein [Candidatus Woesearchaeota archaeon]
MDAQTTEVPDLVDYRGETLRDFRGNCLERGKSYTYHYTLPYTSGGNPETRRTEIRPPIILLADFGIKSSCFFLKLIASDGREYIFHDSYGPAQSKSASHAAGMLERVTEDEIQCALEGLRNKIGQLEEWLKLINS